MPLENCPGHHWNIIFLYHAYINIMESYHQYIWLFHVHLTKVVSILICTQTLLCLLTCLVPQTEMQHIAMNPKGTCHNERYMSIQEYLYEYNTATKKIFYRGSSCNAQKCKVNAICSTVSNCEYKILYCKNVKSTKQVNMTVWHYKHQLINSSSIQQVPRQRG